MITKPQYTRSQRPAPTPIINNTHLSYVISRHASTPPASAQLPPSLPPRALAFAAKGVGCQHDSVPSLRSFTPSNQAQQVQLPRCPVFLLLPQHADTRGDSDKRALRANEKRPRRESHNAVERRRRDNINEKISELATLIPECALDVRGELFLSLFFYLRGKFVVDAIVCLWRFWR